MGRLFGTDGARGIANSELTCELALDIGRAAAMVLTEETHHKSKILIGKDTRISSEMLESALTAGICSAGADVILVGVVPTPAVAYLVDRLGADAGVMISASHNPCEYNGIKLFNQKGYKLSDKIEEEIEAIVLDKVKTHPCPTGGDLGRILRNHEAVDLYIEHIASTTDQRLDGMKIAVDCANGSASATVHKLMERLGADVDVIHDRPDGTNINYNCGSTYMESLTEYVLEHKCDIGLAFDGDADRLLCVNKNGATVDGDQMIAIFAMDMKERGILAKDVAVVTVMSNLGFFRFAEEYGVETAVTKVGDRYVLEEMLNGGYSLGGEQSGHIIFLNYASTGDGQLSAVQLLSVMKRTGKPLHELGSLVTIYPQVLENIVIDAGVSKEDILQSGKVVGAIKAAEELLNDKGRVLVRPSGTEPLIRVMIEGQDYALIQAEALKIADTIRSYQ